jgi:hypothetical protein
MPSPDADQSQPAVPRPAGAPLPVATFRARVRFIAIVLVRALGVVWILFGVHTLTQFASSFLVALGLMPGRFRPEVLLTSAVYVTLPIVLGVLVMVHARRIATRLTPPRLMPQVDDAPLGDLVADRFSKTAELLVVIVVRLAALWLFLEAALAAVELGSSWWVQTQLPPARSLQWVIEPTVRVGAMFVAGVALFATARPFARFATPDASFFRQCPSCAFPLSDAQLASTCPECGWTAQNISDDGRGDRGGAAPSDQPTSTG